MIMLFRKKTPTTHLQALHSPLVGNSFLNMTVFFLFLCFNGISRFWRLLMTKPSLEKNSSGTIQHIAGG